MNRSPVPCALCARFAVKRSTPPGHGHCDGWEKLRRHDDTNEACPLWNRAKDEQRRRTWAEQQPKENT